MLYFGAAENPLHRGAARVLSADVDVPFCCALPSAWFTAELQSEGNH